MVLQAASSSLFMHYVSTDDAALSLACTVDEGLTNVECSSGEIIICDSSISST
jgi:hypothetical protein